MFSRTLFFAIGLTGISLLAGCQGGLAVNYYDNDPPPVEVVHVARGHVCGPGCAHYYDGARYIVIRGHRHGPGCGHVFEGGHWMISVARGPDHAVVEVENAPAARVHPVPVRVVRIPPPPGPVDIYVFNRSGSKWLKIAKGHKHGPGCGHVVVEGHWCLP